MKRLKLFSVILLIGLASCKKEEKAMGSNTEISTPSMIGVSRAPINNNVVLEFTDLDHYEGWLDYLDQSIEDVNCLDEDLTLKLIENNELGNFYSLREEVLVRNGLDDTAAEFSLEEFDALYPCDLIVDDVLKSTLNPHHEVQIGDTIYVYFPGSNIVGVHYRYNEGLLALRGVDKCTSTLNKFSDFMFDSKFTVSLSTPSGNRNSESSIVQCGPGVAGTYSVQAQVPLRLSNNQFDYEFRVSVMRETFLPGPNGEPIFEKISDDDFQSGTISFGDGFSQSFQHAQPFYHRYNSIGTYSVSYTATFFVDERSASYTRTCSFEIEVSENGCFYLHQYQNFSKRRTAETAGWFLQYAAFHNKRTSKDSVYRVGSHTVGWKVKSNGKYKRKRTKLKTGVVGEEFNFLCNLSGRKLDVSKVSKIKRRKLSKKTTSKWALFQVGNLKSHHALVDEGNSITFNHCLN